MKVVLHYLCNLLIGKIANIISAINSKVRLLAQIVYIWNIRFSINSILHVKDNEDMDMRLVKVSSD